MSTPNGSRIDTLLSRIIEHEDKPAIVWAERSLSYAELAISMREWEQRLASLSIGAGRVVAVSGDFSHQSVAALLALFVRGCIAVPLPPGALEQNPRLLATAQATAFIAFDRSDAWTVKDIEHPGYNVLIGHVRASKRAAIVFFSSGSTGESKASLHDVSRWIEKFDRHGKAWRTLSFLLLDHVGGFNTLLATLMAGGALVVPSSRDVDTVCRLIEQQRVEILPSSPTFLRLLLMAEAHRRFDLSSLKLITYGTEPMHEATLRALRVAFPKVRLKQTYGLTELGIFQTKSLSNDSLWVAIGGEGLETKVQDGLLYIRTRGAMLGYLNATSPFDKDGWMNTGDAVEVDGDYLLIKGRATEIINVGGLKVYPAEVEDVLIQIDNVLEATVRGRRNAVTGQVVVATITLERPEDPAAFDRRARDHCAERLASYKVPAIFQITACAQHGSRFKTLRAEGRQP